LVFITVTVGVSDAIAIRGANACTLMVVILFSLIWR
jgi:hypothetical protein